MRGFRVFFEGVLLTGELLVIAKTDERALAMANEYLVKNDYPGKP